MEAPPHDPDRRFTPANRLAWLGALTMTFAVAAMGAGRISAATGMSLIESVAFGQVTMLAVALLFTWRDGGGFRTLGVTGPWKSYDAAIITGIIVVHFTGSIMSMLVMMRMGVITEDRSAFELLKAFGNYDTGTFLLMALGLALQSGFTEELLFRGYLVTRLEQAGLRAWGCILASALVFGLIHWPGYGFWPSISKAVWFGIPAAAFFWYRRSLGPLMVAHAAMNFVGFMLAHLVQRVVPYLPTP
jgi:membrane protease YdiL (CAAX protease family)